MVSETQFSVSIIAIRSEIDSIERNYANELIRILVKYPYVDECISVLVGVVFGSRNIICCFH